MFSETFIELKQQCLLMKKVRFNKKKHKVNAWLTPGILKSINSKNILLVLKFKSFKNIIIRTIMHAKRSYLKNVFNNIVDMCGVEGKRRTL